MEAVQAAAMLSQYGLYAIVAMLCLVTVHLYKKHGDLEAEMRTILTANAKDTAKLLVEATEAIKQSNMAIREINGVVLQMKVLMETCKTWSNQNH